MSSSTATPEHKAIVQAFAQACRFGDDQARIDTGAALFQALAASSAKTAEVLVTDAQKLLTKIVTDRQGQLMSEFCSYDRDTNFWECPEWVNTIHEELDSVLMQLESALAATRAQAVSLPAEPDNPTNLPESLGVSVRDAMTSALLVHGYRTDGDDLAIARRVNFMSIENRDLINLQKVLIAKYRPTAPDSAPVQTKE